MDAIATLPAQLQETETCHCCVRFESPQPTLDIHARTWSVRCPCGNQTEEYDEITDAIAAWNLQNSPNGDWILTHTGLTWSTILVQSS
ncbi:MAG: hypothetical protein DIZ77_12630 [endosymbiont of Seepiophila jonesi]|uniref:Uncharacterized protein n=1 Tax=endosymbiont of Lamellibrachia luymesi TaxID=2200907 RepID=A0A370E1M4_9GAMM|nr:MAG: hypothetical protein DIZ77_12630 [endosymbiont of Seepiophila jonesi]RDH92293.1 MAG: hypothetical protein DIZ79_03830 [endosymbiont of Lamellibrachia luymesi]